MFPTCSSIRRLSITSQYDILKMNEPISLQFGTWSMSMGQEDLKMKRSNGRHEVKDQRNTTPVLDWET